MEKHAPELYELGTSKISNKNLRKALNSDVANYIVKETQKSKEYINNLFGGVKKWLMESAISKLKKRSKI